MAPFGERDAITEHCCFARDQVFLDGKLVSGAKPRGALALTSVSGDERQGGGILWIPDSGDTCRLWLLRRGIRWRQTVYPATGGLVFHAAIETEEPADGEVMHTLRLQAENLYLLLAKRYRSLPPSHKARVEELLFLHYRLQGSTGLVESFAPFRLAGQASYMSLAQVRREVEAERLCALKSGDRIERYDVRHVPVLLLSPGQWEFLADQVELPLRRPPWAPRAGRVIRARLGRLVDGIASLSTRWTARLARPLERDELEPDEVNMLTLIHHRLIMDDEALAVTSRPRQVDVVFVDGRGRNPAVRYEDARTIRLLIMRRHRLVRNGVRAIAETPCNLPLVLAALG